MISRQYLEFSMITMYSSDIKASSKWFYTMLGFQVLQLNTHSAVIQIAPGVLFNLSTNENSARRLDLSTRYSAELRSRLIANHIEIEAEDDNHWFAFRDPDHNFISAWAGGFGMEFIKTKLADHVENDAKRCYLISKDETHLIAQKISNQDEFANASAELSLLCQQQGIVTVGEAMTASKYSQQVDAVYVFIPLAEQPLEQLPNGTEYIRIPAQDYTVFQIHRSKIDDLRSNQIPDRVKLMNEALTRPESFYILESYKDDKYIQAYIPFV